MTTVQGLETHQVPTPERALAPALTPLTDEQILERYSGLLWNALQAFATHPGYFEEMCDAAYAGEQGRAIRSSSARLASLRKRLGAKVRLDGECWTWTASRTNKGVPQMHRPGAPQESGKITARSWTVEQFHGPDETRWMVTATCGNRLCVNPEHAAWRNVDRRR